MLPTFRITRLMNDCTPDPVRDWRKRITAPADFTETLDLLGPVPFPTLTIVHHMHRVTRPGEHSSASQNAQTANRTTPRTEKAAWVL